MTDNVILAAGTIVEQQLSNGSWSRVPSITALGAVGEQSEAKEKTTLADRIKKYGSGLRDAADKNIKGQYIPLQQVSDEYYDDYVLQQAFITRCKNEEEFNMRVKWPDGEVTGFLFKALGFNYDEVSQEDWKMFTVNGKQNSRIVYGASITGTATVSVLGTRQLAISTAPVLTADEYGEVVWTSSAPTKATVSETGLVTGVAAGTTTITADVRGVVASLVVTVA